MRSWTVLGLSFVVIAGFHQSTPARGQIPSMPGPFAPPAAAAPGLTGMPGLSSAPALGMPGLSSAAAAPRTLWSFLGLGKSNLSACKAKLCASPLGQMGNSMLLPFSAMTGGLISSCCPTVPTASDIAGLEAAGGPNSAEAVAAKIKADEAGAKARRAAVRYLSTVSCHYWPEAEAALIISLRADRNECVRYEAALALLNGCCCTEKTIEALNLTVSGSDKDGNPSEISGRVRCAAFEALHSCLFRYVPPPEPPVPLERPEAAAAFWAWASKRPQVQRASYYYVTLQSRTPVQIVDGARHTVRQWEAMGLRPADMMPGERSVAGALARAMEPSPPPAPSVAPSAAPAPEPVPLRLEVEDDGVKRARADAPSIPANRARQEPTRSTGAKRTEGSASGSKPVSRHNLRDILLDSFQSPFSR